MGNEHHIRHLLRLLPRQGHLELFDPTVPFVWVELRLFSRGLEGGIVAGRVGLERAGEVSSGHEQKYEEVEEESDLPDR